MRNSARSEEFLSRAKLSVAGGDSSTMRVLPYHPPLVAASGQGCRIRDVDGNEYIDLNMAYGPLLFGHRPPFLMEAVTRQLRDSGSQLGFPQELNFLAAENIQHLFPAMERLRFANSGTEAVASAVRLARVHTGRAEIILFEGHYHGWSDAVFHRYHASLEELSEQRFGPAIPGTSGLVGAPLHATVVPWNDAAALAAALESLDGRVAAILMEPVMGNAGVIPPLPGYLGEVKQLAHQHGALLIFDEVITGLRVSAGGAQQRYAVAPDITVISKAVGSGFPVAAFGASKEIMQHIVDGELFHGGVYSGNAMVLSAVTAVTGRVLAESEHIYAELEARSRQLASGIDALLNGRSIPHVVQRVGPMLSFLVTTGTADPLTDYRAVRRNIDFDRYIRLQHALLDHGVYVHPNQFEPLYLSVAHRREDVDEVLTRFNDTLRDFER